MDEHAKYLVGYFQCKDLFFKVRRSELQGGKLNSVAMSGHVTKATIELTCLCLLNLTARLIVSKQTKNRFFTVVERRGNKPKTSKVGATLRAQEARSCLNMLKGCLMKMIQSLTVPKKPNRSYTAF